MRRLIVAVALVALSACQRGPDPEVTRLANSIGALLATMGQAPASSSSGRFGAVAAGGTNYCYWQTNLPTISGNNQTITVFDTTAGGTQRGVYAFLNRFMFTCNFDQTVTVNHDIQLGTSTTWSRAAGTNASYSYTGGTSTTGTTEVDHLVQGNETRIQAVTGGTGPSVRLCALRLCFVRDLGQ